MISLPFVHIFDLILDLKSALAVGLFSNQSNQKSQIKNLKSHSLSKGHSQTLQQSPCLFIVARTGHNRNVHAAQLVDLVEIDLRKNELLANSDRVIAAAIKGLR